VTMPEADLIVEATGPPSIHLYAGGRPVSRGKDPPRWGAPEVGDPRRRGKLKSERHRTLARRNRFRQISPLTAIHCAFPSPVRGAAPPPLLAKEVGMTFDARARGLLDAERHSMPWPVEQTSFGSNSPSLGRRRWNNE
jgi:hypothetical protein